MDTERPEAQPQETTVTLDAKILAYVEWAREQINIIDQDNASETELRAFVYQAAHYRYQAGILCEAANFIGHEAELKLERIEEARAEQKAAEAIQKTLTIIEGLAYAAGAEAPGPNRSPGVSGDPQSPSEEATPTEAPEAQRAAGDAGSRG